MIRPLVAADADWAARQHAALMENSVFALFGTGFLAAIYREFALSKAAVAFVYESEKAHVPMGVIACAADRGSFLRGLALRSGWRLAGYAALGALRRPACRRLLLQSGGYLNKTGHRRGGSGAEMIFITVAPEARGGNIARDLIIAVLAEFHRRGIEEAGVSIESGNDVIRKVLFSLGFQTADTFHFADKRNDFLIVDTKNFTGGEGRVH